MIEVTVYQEPGMNFWYKILYLNITHKPTKPHYPCESSSSGIVPQHVEYNKYCNGFDRHIARQWLRKHAQQWKLYLNGRMLYLVARQQSARVSWLGSDHVTRVFCVVCAVAV